VAVIGWVVVLAVGVAAIVWGAETFAENLAVAAARLGVSTFALAVLLAGAEPEELATAVTASLRHVPAIAFGDVIGANVAVCLVALGVGAVVASLPFDREVWRYALFGLPTGALAAAVAWDGRVGRAEATLLVAAYLVFVATVWLVERRPPMLGETAEVAEATEALHAASAPPAEAGTLGTGVTGGEGEASGAAGTAATGETDVAGTTGTTSLGAIGGDSEAESGAGEAALGAGDRVAAGDDGRGRGPGLSRVGRELALVVAGVAAMAVGASALVEGVRRISDVEETQTRLGLVVVGFATAFELVVLAWSSARRGVTTAVVAGVVGSFTYNVTMTLGAGALARPLRVLDASQLRLPWVLMLASLATVLVLAWPARRLGRAAGVTCLALYATFVVVVLAR
jgi:Ca2+/Na+ antiporter